MKTTLPFEAVPARARRPALGLVLIVVSYLLPCSLLFAGYTFAYYTTFAVRVPVVTRMSGGLALFACLIAAVYVARLAFKAGAGLRQLDALQLLATDRRSAVLYLRSFDDDGVPDLTGSILPIGPQRTVETGLSRALRDLGPVVSIGRPGEHLPELGANRFYVSDDAWQQAVRYFLERAAAVIILVGNSTGVGWEITTALRAVAPEKILFVFPFVLPTDKRTKWQAFREGVRPGAGRGDHVSTGMLAALKKEQEARYQTFRKRVADLLSTPLPEQLEGALFLDFAADGEPRLIPSRLPVFVRRQRDKQGVTLDYRRTLRPFLEKLLRRPIAPGRFERALSDPAVLLPLTVACGLTGIVTFSAPFTFGFGPLGLIVFFLGMVPLNLAYWGVWNYSRQARRQRRAELASGPRPTPAQSRVGTRQLEGCGKSTAAALVGGCVGALFGWVVYTGARWPPSSESVVGGVIAAIIDGAGGLVAGLVIGLRLSVLGRVAVVTGIGLGIACVILWSAGLPWQSTNQRDWGDWLMLAFPCLAFGGAIWGRVQSERISRAGHSRNGEETNV